MHAAHNWIRTGIKAFNGVDFPCLKNLNINENLIGDEGIQWLLKARMPNLNTLWAGKNYANKENNKIYEKGIKALSQGHWKLTFLSISNNRTEKTAKWLNRAPFNLR